MDKVVEAIEQNLQFRRSEWAAGPLDVHGNHDLEARSDFSLLDEQQTFALAAAAAAQRRSFDQQWRSQQQWREFRAGLASTDYWKSVVQQLRSRAEQVLQPPRQYDCDGRCAHHNDSLSGTADSCYSGSLNEQSPRHFAETREPPPPANVQEQAARAALRAKEIGGYCKERILNEWKQLNQGRVGGISLEDIRSIQSVDDVRALQHRQQDESIGNYYVPFDGDNSFHAQQQQSQPRQQPQQPQHIHAPESVGMGEYASLPEDTPASCNQHHQLAAYASQQPCVVDRYVDMEDESWQRQKLQQHQEHQPQTRREQRQAPSSRAGMLQSPLPKSQSHDQSEEEPQSRNSRDADGLEGDCSDSSDESGTEDNEEQQEHTIALHPNAFQWGANGCVSPQQQHQPPATVPQMASGRASQDTSGSSGCPKKMAQRYQHSYHWGAMTPKHHHR